MEYTDLHCHYLPGIDDGVKTPEEGIALLRGLARAGFGRVVATPHIRTALFENRRDGVLAASAAFAERVASEADLPALGVGAEHFCDELFWRLFEARQLVAYPGGKAVLVELPSEAVPSRLPKLVFELRVRGLTPVLAHPERYTAFLRSSDTLEELIDAGVLPLLDVMSLADRYGRAPRVAAERMLDEGLYFAACSDAHKPGDADIVMEAITRLRRLVGHDEADELLGENTRRVLEGTFEDWLTG